MSAGSLGMDDALRDALAVEVSDLVDQSEVLQQYRDQFALHTAPRHQRSALTDEQCGDAGKAEDTREGTRMQSTDPTVSEFWLSSIGAPKLVVSTGAEWWLAWALRIGWGR